MPHIDEWITSNDAIIPHFLPNSIAAATDLFSDGINKI